MLLLIRALPWDCPCVTLGAAGCYLAVAGNTWEFDEQVRYVFELRSWAVHRLGLPIHGLESTGRPS